MHGSPGLLQPRLGLLQLVVSPHAFLLPQWLDRHSRRRCRDTDDVRIRPAARTSCDPKTRTCGLCVGNLGACSDVGCCPSWANLPNQGIVGLISATCWNGG